MNDLSDGKDTGEGRQRIGATEPEAATATPVAQEAHTVSVEAAGAPRGRWRGAYGHQRGSDGLGDHHHRPSIGPPDHGQGVQAREPDGSLDKTKVVASIWDGKARMVEVPTAEAMLAVLEQVTQSGNQALILNGVQERSALAGRSVS